MQFDLNLAAQLTSALGPDLLLMGGAMALLLWSGWRRESDEHQRTKPEHAAFSARRAAGCAVFPGSTNRLNQSLW